MKNRIFLEVVLLLSLFLHNVCTQSITFINPIRFPYGPIEGPYAGIFLALTFPVNLPDTSLSFSYNIEGNYDVPLNQSEFTYPPIVSRMFSRRSFYDMLEFKLKSHGYPGKHCILRTICEASVFTTEGTGILGDLVHIILSPSTSKEEQDLVAYNKAEIYGKTKKQCYKYNKKCQFSIIDVFSVVKKIYNEFM